METKKEKKTQKSVGTGALAGKYNCSRAYVCQVLKKGGETVLARKIRKDADDIMAIIERDTTITV